MLIQQTAKCADGGREHQGGVHITVTDTQVAVINSWTEVKATDTAVPHLSQSLALRTCKLLANYAVPGGKAMPRTGIMNTRDRHLTHKRIVGHVAHPGTVLCKQVTTCHSA